MYIPCHAAPDSRPNVDLPGKSQTTIQTCLHDGAPCYVGAGTDDAHWRCGTVQCGSASVKRYRDTPVIQDEAIDDQPGKSQTTRKKVPVDVVLGMRIRPDPSVPPGTIFVNPDDYRAWQGSAYDPAEEGWLDQLEAEARYGQF
jgi:hypothetical protein